MANNDTRDQAPDSRDIPPKGGHKSSNDETVTPGGHVQRKGEGGDTADQRRRALAGKTPGSPLVAQGRSRRRGR